MVPSYLALYASGELHRRARQARQMMEHCELCARHCRVNRLVDLRGSACRIGEHAVVASHGPHFGEERPLSGTRGSGTIFFSRCNLRCVFCQNHDISQRGVGQEVRPAELAERMLELQELGCHNVNLVSPSHVIAQLLAALPLAVERGLCIPLVYNTGGFDSPEGLQLLDGVIDIYLPDMKYGDSGTAREFSRVRNYTTVNRAAVREMHRQVGDLVLDDEGVARRGLLVRHLVLPHGLAGTGKVLKFVAEQVSPETYVNLMDQYHPCFRAFEFPTLDRPLTPQEYRRALTLAERYGIHRLERRGALNELRA